MRISDWSSDVCSSDLPASHAAVVTARQSLKSLSRERIADELLKILALPDPRALVGQMADDRLFEVLLPELDAGFAAALDRLVANDPPPDAPLAPPRRTAPLLRSVERSRGPGCASNCGSRGARHPQKK